jgi:hypothetical protein
LRIKGFGLESFRQKLEPQRSQSPMPRERAPTTQTKRHSVYTNGFSEEHLESGFENYLSALRTLRPLRLKALFWGRAATAKIAKKNGEN